jgi:hypothetical protein
MNTNLNLQEVRILKQLAYDNGYKEIYTKMMELEISVLNAKAVQNAKREYALKIKNNSK